MCRQWPVESFVKIIAASIDLTLKVHDGYVSSPKRYIEPLRAMHIPMLLGFWLGAWVEVLVHYRVIYPRRITQIMLALAFTMETLTMIFHTHETNILEAHLHRLLAVTMFCSMIGGIGECFHPNTFALILGRSFFMLTQGTWFIQTAFVLWPLADHPYFVWDRNSHDSLSYATMCFGFHLAANTTTLLILFLLIQKIMSHSRKSNFNQVEDEHHMDGYKLIVNESDKEN